MAPRWLHGRGEALVSEGVDPPVLVKVASKDGGGGLQHVSELMLQVLSQDSYVQEAQGLCRGLQTGEGSVSSQAVDVLESTAACKEGLQQI